MRINWGVYVYQLGGIHGINWGVVCVSIEGGTRII